MGWQRQEGYNYWMSFPSNDTFKLHALIAAWKPSESIEAAMQVLTKFDVWNINKTDHPDFADRPYSVMVGFHESEHTSRVKYFEVQASTIPEGVCRAALAAIETKKN